MYRRLGMKNEYQELALFQGLVTMSWESYFPIHIKPQLVRYL